MDARNYIEDLIRAKQAGEKKLAFDFILLDVFTGGAAIPYHLVTAEFNQKIAQLLTVNGLYVINLIDLESSPRFLKSMIKTLNITFTDINVVLPGEKNIYKRNRWRTYVLIASKREFNQEELELSQLGGRRLNATDLEMYLNDVKGVDLTDDFAPTEILLKKVFAKKGQTKLYNKMTDVGMKLYSERKINKAIAQFEKILHMDPNFPGAHVNVGSLLALQGKDTQAIKHYFKALEADPEFKSAFIGLGNVYEKRDSAFWE